MGFVGDCKSGVAVLAFHAGARYMKEKGIELEVPSSVDMFPSQKQKIAEQILEGLNSKVPGLSNAIEFYGCGEAGKNATLTRLLLDEHPLAEASADAGAALDEPDESEEGEGLFKIDTWLEQAFQGIAKEW